MVGERPPGRRWLPGLALGTLALGGPLAAQRPGLTATAELGLGNRFHWRGIRAVDAPVAQGLLTVGATLGSLRLSGGTWGLAQLRRAGTGSASLLPSGHRGLAELDLWSQVEGVFHQVELTAGFLYRNFERNPLLPQTSELFARFEWVNPVLAPRVELWRDIDRLRGAYLETALSRIIASPLPGAGVNLLVSLITGWSFDQRRVSGQQPGVGAFTGDGPTHTELLAGLRLSPGKSAVIDLGAHFQASWDRTTRGLCASPPMQHACAGVWISAATTLVLPGRARP